MSSFRALLLQFIWDVLSTLEIVRVWVLRSVIPLNFAEVSSFEVSTDCIGHASPKSAPTTRITDAFVEGTCQRAAKCAKEVIKSLGVTEVHHQFSTVVTDLVAQNLSGADLSRADLSEAVLFC